MTPRVHSEEELFAAAGKGALILTATRRLARQLRTRFDLRMGNAGRQAWLSPAIHGADQWLRVVADTLDDGWCFLVPPAARHLWERIIDADGAAGGGLLQAAATARRAEEAHSLLTEYADGEVGDFPLTADHAAFLRWRRSYLDTCRREGWVDSADLGERVRQAVAGGKLPLPTDIWLVGFDELPPRFHRLAAAFAAGGARTRVMPPPTAPTGEVTRLPCADPREEVRQAARWTGALLEQGADQIGIVVPDLEGYRPLLERILREEIDPASQVDPGGTEIRFNFSLGTPLDRQGAAAAALAILAAGSRLSVGEASFLLRTPYLGGSMGEAAARAVRERRLRKSGADGISLKSFAAPAEGDRRTEPRTLSFAAICRHLLAAAQDRRRLQPGGWAREFAHLLHAIGWPGERPLDSHDYQVVKAWREKVLSQLAAFDLVSGPVPRGEAVSLVRRLAAETEFQPEGPESPVQVVGMLEAAGLDFKHLWVMGMHDGVLPAPSRPNPFLPVPLQVAAGMPHADAGREAVFARRIAARLFAAAPTVIFSHPVRQGDADLLPSPLIRDLPVLPLPLRPSRAPAVLCRQGGHVAEAFDDAKGPPLTVAAAVGGTAILRDQALCPFRAFARHRLGAAALEEPEIGLDAGERGTLLHKVLELFWRETVDQAGLLALGAGGVAERLRRHIAAAVDAVYAERPRPAPQLLQLEQDRLLLLLCEWLLGVEAERPPFTVVALEQEHRDDCGGVEIATRIDRIDRLADGTLAVIDYKTGQVDAALLLEERLLEPQLPIYAVSREGDLGAVALASLRRGKSGFAGVGREAGLLPKVPAVLDWKKTRDAGIGSWQQLLVRWRIQLHALGRAFAAGDATVDPASAEKACRYCDLMSLCRIHERGGGPLEGEE